MAFAIENLCSVLRRRSCHLYFLEIDDWLSSFDRSTFLVLSDEIWNIGIGMHVLYFIYRYSYVIKEKPMFLNPSLE